MLTTNYFYCILSVNLPCMAQSCSGSDFQFYMCNKQYGAVPKYLCGLQLFITLETLHNQSTIIL